MYILIISALLPVILLLKYINGKDMDKEPSSLLNKILWAGVISAVPAYILEKILNNFFPIEIEGNVPLVMFNMIISVGLVEELCKFFAAYIHTKDNPEFNHKYDAIVYCVYATLGFAGIENLLYIVLGGGLITAIVRAVLSVPFHACAAIIVGYFYGDYREKKLAGKSGGFSLVTGIAISSILHGIFDGLLQVADENASILNPFSDKYMLFFYILVITLYIICFGIIKRVSKLERNMDGSITVPTPTYVNHNAVEEASKIRYCINCGAPISDNYCAFCGTKKV